MIQAQPKNWYLAVDYMRDSIGCKMTSAEQKEITEFLEQNYPGPVYPLTWTEVLTTPAGTGWNIVSLVSIGDYLYFGTEGGGRIFRSADGISWEEVADTGHDKVYGITAYHGAIYAGSFNPLPQIWRSTDGRTWAPVATLPDNQVGVTALGIFEGDLYAGTGAARIYRSSDGTHWQEAGILKQVERAEWPHWVRFLISFNGKLYAGLEGGGIFTTENGADWSEVALPMSGQSGVRGGAVFQDYLYVGTTGTGEIWRSEDGLHWQEVLKLGTGHGYIPSMAVFNRALYASLNQKVLRSFDGLHWEPVGEISPKTIEAMEAFKGHLYAGTTRPPGGQIYRTTGLVPSRIKVPDRDIAVIGKVTGNYMDIQTGYYLYEVLEENLLDGVSVLEHKWTIQHSGGRRLTFAVRAYHPSRSDGDSFVFSYSVDDKHYNDMVTIHGTQETRSYEFFELPSLPAGTFYIRVKNTNRTKGHTALDRLYLDHLYLLVEGERAE